jgi:hypothetical protein
LESAEAAKGSVGAENIVIVGGLKPLWLKFWGLVSLKEGSLCVAYKERPINKNPYTQTHHSPICIPCYSKT